MAETGGQEEIEASVASALERYEFYRRPRDYALVRCPRSGGSIERLIDGQWVRVRGRDPRSDSNPWEQLPAPRLGLHMRRYLIADLGSTAVGWSQLWQRLRRSAWFRWAMPPLKGGSGKRLDPDAVERSRRAYLEQLFEVEGEDLTELKEQALLGYEHQRERVASAEQRATFFLGAAGLTTSLVLANAGLLLGTSKLETPWLELAAAALAVASACAIVAGVRAMQATMITFVRTPPNGVPRVMRRRHFKGDRLLRSYIGALVVAAGRVGVIGDWKIRRLGSARRWFFGAIAGVVVLTAFVLVDAVG